MTEEEKKQEKLRKREKRREAWNNAFYVNNDREALSESDIELLDKFAIVVVRRRLTTAFIFFLELHRPMNYLTSQALVFTGPLLDVLLSMVRPFFPWMFSKEDMEQLSKILENRKSVEILIERVHHFEDEYESDPPAFNYKYPKKTKEYFKAQEEGKKRAEQYSEENENTEENEPPKDINNTKN